MEKLVSFNEAPDRNFKLVVVKEHHVSDENAMSIAQLIPWHLKDG